MRGTILGYDAPSHTGAVSGHDGNRYEFAINEWKSPGPPAKGMLVDFVAIDGQATKIYVVEAPAARSQGWLAFLFSSNDRVPRKQYWLRYILPAMAIYIVAAILDESISSGRRESSGLFRGLTWLFFVWPSFAIAAKRLHDRGISGWWAALANGFIPVMILAVAAYWYWTKMKAAEAASAGPEPGMGLGILVVCTAAFLTWLYFTIQIGFLRGQAGPNRYGEDPLPTSADVRSDNTATAVFGTVIVLFFLVLPVSAYWYWTKMKAAEALPQPQSLEGNVVPDPSTPSESDVPSQSPQPN